MKWNKDTKEELSYIGAFLALIFGLAITCWGFVIDPQGEIHNSVLWVLGQCLFYSGAVFGICSYVQGEIKKIKSDIGMKD